MVQSLEWLSHKHENPSSNLPHSCQSWACAIQTSVLGGGGVKVGQGEVETEEFLELTGGLF